MNTEEQLLFSLNFTLITNAQKMNAMFPYTCPVSERLECTQTCTEDNFKLAQNSCCCKRAEYEAVKMGPNNLLNYENELNKLNIRSYTVTHNWVENLRPNTRATHEKLWHPVTRQTVCWSRENSHITPDWHTHTYYSIHGWSDRDRGVSVLLWPCLCFKKSKREGRFIKRNNKHGN